RGPLVLAALSATALLLAAVGAGVGYKVLHPAAPAPPGSGVEPDDKPRPLTAEERAKLPSPFDGRKREDIPRALLAPAGGGDPGRAPAELVAVLGEGGFNLFPDRDRGWMGQSADGRVLAVPCGSVVVLFDGRTGERLRALTGHPEMVYTAAVSPD